MHASSQPGQILTKLSMDAFITRNSDADSLVPLNKDLSIQDLRIRLGQCGPLMKCVQQSLNLSLENVIGVLNVLLPHSSDKTELASFLARVTCEWQQDDQMALQQVTAKWGTWEEN